MELQPNTYYRTRDGRKAYVAGNNPFNGNSAYPWRGWIEGDSTMKSWTSSGAWFHESGSDDLIAIWTDRPPDEPGWEIVEDPDAVIQDGWQFWSPVLREWHVATDTVARRIGDVLRRGEQWRWYRRPVKHEPREWHCIKLSDNSIRGYETCGEVEGIASAYNVMERFVVREVIE